VPDGAVAVDQPGADHLVRLHVVGALLRTVRGGGGRVDEEEHHVGIDGLGGLDHLGDRSVLELALAHRAAGVDPLQDDHLAGEVGELDLLAGGVLQGERRGGLADRGVHVGVGRAGLGIVGGKRKGNAAGERGGDAAGGDERQSARSGSEHLLWPRGSDPRPGDQRCLVDAPGAQ